jgi:Tfp pilus assembly protein PilN
MATINLAPGTQFIVAARKRRRRLYLMSVAIAGVFALIWFGLYFYTRQLRENLEHANADLRGIQIEINKLEPDANRIFQFEQRLGALDSLLNVHISWEPLLQDLERLLPGDTVLTDLEVVNSSGNLKVQGTTSSIDQVAVTLASLIQSDNHRTAFLSGTLNSVLREEVAGGEEQPPSVRYLFSAELRFDPALVQPAR